MTPPPSLSPLRRALAAVLSWLHLCIMGLTIIPYALVLFVVALFRKGEPIYRVGVAWLAVCVHSARWLLGIDYRVQGMENLPAYIPAGNTDLTTDLNSDGGDAPRRGVVLLVKHQSTYETFLMPLILRHVVLSYVFKKELLSIPFFGWGIGRMDMVHIDRSQGSKAFHKVLEQGRKLLEMGNWIIMFPEGTRVPRGEVGTYKASGARLAVDTEALVVPVAVASARCWPPRAIVKYPGVVDVSIGAPIDTRGKKPAELLDEVQEWIETEMRRIDPEAYADAPAMPATPSTAAAPAAPANATDRED